MGWKAFKEHYRIDHIVRVDDGTLQISSPYIYKIIAINSDGEIVKGYTGENDDLMRYQKEIKADQNLAKSLLAQPDTFGDLITVYTFEDGKIVEKQCEILGWPNCTTDGILMHENTFFESRGGAVACAVQELKLSIKGLIERSEELKTERRKVDLEIGESMAKLDELKREIEE